jgi:CubicO group peptidase (beta-lactamase class C family)
VLFRSSIPFLMASMDRRSPLYRAMFLNPGPYLPLDEAHIYARNLEIPAGGGVGSARAIAWAYSVFANGGKELGLRQETLRALMAPPVPPQYGFYDQCMMREMAFSLGFLKPCRAYPFGHPGAFGEPGAGGSFGFADPEGKTGYAYTPNRMLASQGGDARDLALRKAFFHSIGLALPVYQ